MNTDIDQSCVRALTPMELASSVDPVAHATCTAAGASGLQTRPWQDVWGTLSIEI